MKYLVFIICTFLFCTSTNAQIWTEKTKLIASDIGKTKLFGIGISIDGNFAIVGSAYGHQGSVTPAPAFPDAGAAFIYEKDVNGDWNEIQKLTPSDGEPYDAFGASVAIHGNYAVVGAEKEDHDSVGENPINDAGSVYIFERDVNGKWNQVQKIVASERKTKAWFGGYISLYGDYLLVNTRGLSIVSDRVYMFRRDVNGHWSEIQKINPSDGKPTDYFGNGMSLGEDYAVIGSHIKREDLTGGNLLQDAGMVYIFQKDQNGMWHEAQRVVASDRGYKHNFGSKISFDGTHILVNAPGNGKDASGGNFIQDAGAAYIFEQNRFGVWTEVQKIVASDRDVGDIFGSGVSIENNHCVVGAHLEKEGAFGNTPVFRGGAAYIFEKNANGVWNETQKISAVNRGRDDFYGRDVVIKGNQIMVGSFFKDEVDAVGDSIVDAGSVFVYELSRSLGISQNNFGPSFKFYPNPTKGNLTIKLGQVYTDIEVEIMNVAGQVIQDESFDSTDQLELEVKGEAGLYLMKIHDSDGTNALLKIVKTSN